jgi:RNA polymerase sigma factor (sigma-70 family)
MQTKNPQLEDIKFEIEQALKSLASQKGDQFVTSIRPILYTNLDRGRIQGFIETEINRVSEYVSDVADYYISLSSLISKLQIEKTEEVWEPLSEKLQRWAYYFFIRSKFHAGIETQEIANECANTAAITILEAYFPYDTDFDPWAHVIVLNTCRKFIWNATKKSVIPPNSIVELDETLSAMSASVFENRKYQEVKSDVLNAISQLSDVRRQVIELHYLDGFSLPEIAKIMGKSIGAIYSLHFNALDDLRKILGTNRDNT